MERVRLDLPAEYKTRLDDLAYARRQSTASLTRELMIEAIDRASKKAKGQSGEKSEVTP